MNLQPVLIREKVVHFVRSYFRDNGFHEIITPTFNTALPLEPNLHAFGTTWHTVGGEKKLYLSQSPESGLKKMIAAGIGNCFAIGKSFRNLEDAGSTHIPEFLMLEWYRENATYETIMHDTEDLLSFLAKNITTSDNQIKYQGNVLELATPWPRYTMNELFRKYAQVDLSMVLNDKEMTDTAAKKGYKTANANWEQLFNQIFLNEIEPNLGNNPCFVVDFPSRISPLCTPKKDDSRYSQRFEIYLAGMELGNGNTENTDVSAIKSVFEEEKKRREVTRELAPPIDDVFLDSLEKMQSQSYAGIGLGVDRLAMIIANANDITDVEPLVVH